MRRPFPAARGLVTVLAATLTLGLSAESCGVMSSSSDCNERASCPPDGTIGDDVGIEAGDDEAAATEAGEASGEENAADVGSEEALADVDASDGGDATDAPSEGDGGSDVRDVGPPDVPGDGADACATTPEDCTNGIDDNCDGKIDCADPQCQPAYQCVPPVPTGWSGPVELAQAANAGSIPACQANYGSPLMANAGLNTPPLAQCGTCSCAAAGQTCSASVAVDVDTNCNTSCTAVATTTGLCASLPACTGLGTSFSAMLPPPLPSGGSCSPNTVPPNPTLPPVTWATTARICGYDGRSDQGGCTGATQCISMPTGSYGSKPCVYMTGTVPTTCPAGYNTTGPTTFYQGTNETRTCTSCSCTTAAPTGGSCTGSIDIFSSTAGGCIGTPGSSYTMNSVCNHGLSVAPKPGFVMANYTLTTGTCAVQSQPSATGTVTVASPITVCCM